MFYHCQAVLRQTAEVRWGVAITLDMWLLVEMAVVPRRSPTDNASLLRYLLSTPLNVGLQEAGSGLPQGRGGC